jgi:hypothetical protein
MSTKPISFSDPQITPETPSIPIDDKLEAVSLRVKQARDRVLDCVKDEQSMSGLAGGIGIASDICSLLGTGRGGEVVPYLNFIPHSADPKPQNRFFQRHLQAR